MLQKTYEAWLRAELAQADADLVRADTRASLLRRALAEYLASHPTVEQSGQITFGLPPIPPALSTRVKRRSKYENLFQLFAQTERPLTIDEMLQIAEDHGVHLDRHHIRSINHTQKKLGRTTEQNGRYLWHSPDTQSASTEEVNAD